MKTKQLRWALTLALVVLAAPAFSQVIQGTYAIQNVQTGLLLRIKDANKTNGTPIVGYTPVNWKCMTWDFRHVEGQVYQLRNLFSQKTFRPARRPAAGTTLEEQPLANNDSLQLYEFIPVAKDVYLIRLKGTALYLTSADSDATVNAAIVLSAKTGGRQQQWSIYLQDPQF